MANKPLPLTPRQANRVNAPLPLTPPERNAKVAEGSWTYEAPVVAGAAVAAVAPDHTAVSVAEGVVEGVGGAIMDYLEDHYLEQKFNEIKEITGKNPHFTNNGHDGESPLTEKTLRNWKCKSLASTGFSIAGTIGSHWIGVNAANTAKHGSATATSGAHLYKFEKMAARAKAAQGDFEPDDCFLDKLQRMATDVKGDNGSLRRHLRILISLKQMKALHRGVRTATSLVPLLNTLDHTGGVASLLANRASSLLCTGLLGNFAREVAKTALDLHWQAYRELVLSEMLHKRRDGSGPCLRMVRELFTRRSFTWFLPKTDIDTIMREPEGFKVILYKLKQA